MCASLCRRLLVLLSFFRWQPNRYKFRRYKLVSLFQKNIDLGVQGGSRVVVGTNVRRDHSCFYLFLIIVLYGTLKQPSRPPHSLGILEMWWVFLWVLTWGLLFLVLVMPLPSYGIFEMECVDNLSLDMCQTLMLSV